MSSGLSSFVRFFVPNGWLISSTVPVWGFTNYGSRAPALAGHVRSALLSRQNSSPMERFANRLIYLHYEHDLANRKRPPEFSSGLHQTQLVQLREKHVGGEHGLIHARTLECFLLDSEGSRTESYIVKGRGPGTVRTSRSLRCGTGRRRGCYGKRQSSILWIVYELTA